METPKQKQPIPEHAKKVFSGVIFDIYQWEQQMYDGTVKTFEKAKRPSSVVIFPILDNQKILMTQQEQPGRGSYVSLPGGRIDENEDIVAAAKRELLEETGYQAENFILWKTIYPSVKVDYAAYYFIAKGCVQVKDQSLDGGERVVLQELTFDDFMETMRNQRSADKEIIAEIYEALLDPEKYAQLKELFMNLN